jgi:hypothetical protein
MLSHDTSIALYIQHTHGLLWSRLGIVDYALSGVAQAMPSPLKSKSKLFYDRCSQSIQVSGPLLGPQANFTCSLSWNYILTVAGLLLLSLIWKYLSQVQFLQDRLSNFIVSDLILTQCEWPGSCIYFPQEQGNSVIPLGTGLYHQLLLKPKLN